MMREAAKRSIGAWGFRTELSDHISFLVGVSFFVLFAGWQLVTQLRFAEQLRRARADWELAHFQGVAFSGEFPTVRIETPKVVFEQREAVGAKGSVFYVQVYSAGAPKFSMVIEPRAFRFAWGWFRPAFQAAFSVSNEVSAPLQEALLAARNEGLPIRIAGGELVASLNGVATPEQAKARIKLVENVVALLG